MALVAPLAEDLADCWQAILVHRLVLYSRGERKPLRLTAQQFVQQITRKSGIAAIRAMDEAAVRSFLHNCRWFSLGVFRDEKSGNETFDLRNIAAEEFYFRKCSNVRATAHNLGQSLAGFLPPAGRPRRLEVKGNVVILRQVMGLAYKIRHKEGEGSGTWVFTCVVGQRAHYVPFIATLDLLNFLHKSSIPKKNLPADHCQRGQQPIDLKKSHEAIGPLGNQLDDHQSSCCEEHLQSADHEESRKGISSLEFKPGDDRHSSSCQEHEQSVMHKVSHESISSKRNQPDEHKSSSCLVEEQPVCHKESKDGFCSLKNQPDDRHTCKSQTTKEQFVDLKESQVANYLQKQQQYDRQSCSEVTQVIDDRLTTLNIIGSQINPLFDQDDGYGADLVSQSEEHQPFQVQAVCPKDLLSDGHSNNYQEDGCTIDRAQFTGVPKDFTKNSSSCEAEKSAAAPCTNVQPLGHGQLVDMGELCQTAEQLPISSSSKETEKSCCVDPVSADVNTTNQSFSDAKEAEGTKEQFADLEKFRQGDSSSTSSQAGATKQESKDLQLLHDRSAAPVQSSMIDHPSDEQKPMVPKKDFPPCDRSFAIDPSTRVQSVLQENNRQTLSEEPAADKGKITRQDQNNNCTSGVRIVDIAVNQDASSNTSTSMGRSNDHPVGGSSGRIVPPSLFVLPELLALVRRQYRSPHGNAQPAIYMDRDSLRNIGPVYPPQSYADYQRPAGNRRRYHRQPSSIPLIDYHPSRNRRQYHRERWPTTEQMIERMNDNWRRSCPTYYQRPRMTEGVQRHRRDQNGPWRNSNNSTASGLQGGTRRPLADIRNTTRPEETGRQGKSSCPSPSGQPARLHKGGAVPAGVNTKVQAGWLSGQLMWATLKFSVNNNYDLVCQVLDLTANGEELAASELHPYFLQKTGSEVVAGPTALADSDFAVADSLLLNWLSSANSSGEGDKTTSDDSTPDDVHSIDGNSGVGSDNPLLLDLPPLLSSRAAEQIILNVESHHEG